MKRNVWIRVDADSTIGRGHLSRCLALAAMLGEEFGITFLIRAACRSYCWNMLEGRNVTWIDHDESIPCLLDQDDLLITDSYAIDNAWRQRFKPLVKALIDVNDLPGEILGATVVVNHCPGITPDLFTSDDDTRFLLGMEYAILRPEFLEHASVKNGSEIGEGIFVSFGGADPYNLGGQAVESLLQAGFSDPIYFVTANRDDRTLLAGQADNVQLLSGLSAEEMRLQMLKARLLFIPTSILCFEAIALRKPIVALYYVENQRLIYEGLVARGMVRGVGFVDGESDFKELSAMCVEAYEDQTLLEALIQRCSTGIDGKSGDRIRSGLNNLPGRDKP